MEFLSRILQLPEVASAHGVEIDRLLVYIHLLMAALFAGWLAYFLFVILRFRKSANPKASYEGTKSHVSSYAEIAVAVIEAVLLLGFAVPIWARAVDRLPDPKKAIDVQIMGMQFQWNAHLAGADGKWGKQDIKFASSGNPFGIDPNDPAGKDDVVCLREPFLVPEGEDVICRISSMDVIHSFKVPRMRVCQDAIPGMSIPLHFRPTKQGEMMIICAQLCGNLHSTMKGSFKVVSRPEFDKWYAEKSKSGGAGGFE
jgi:cytochrome c oxidase subunit II